MREIVQVLQGLRLNQSRIMLYADCPRKFYWKYRLHLEPDRPQMNLEIGKAVHVALERMGLGDSTDMALGKGLKSFTDGMPKRRLPSDEEVIENAEILINNLVRAYVDFWGGKRQWIPLGNEVMGQVLVGNGPHSLVFKTDKFVNFHHSLWVVDHKTAAKMDLRELLKYQMDFQMTSYIYGASKVLGTRVQGVIVDFLVKTKTPQFAQELYTRTDEELFEYEHDFNQYADEIEMATNKEGVFEAQGLPGKFAWRKNTKECFRFGTCPYRELCLKDNEVHRAVFIKRTEDYVDDPKLLTAAPGPDVRNESGPGDVQGS